jgi:hypothetical protein
MTFTGTSTPDRQIGTKELKGCRGAPVTHAPPIAENQQRAGLRSDSQLLLTSLLEKCTVKIQGDRDFGAGVVMLLLTAALLWRRR